ncbi:MULTISPECIES: enoyl-CoA hydratase/isomerase family protein [unclassified Solwaraspora]|uniref:enoyl-CoA hydratase/isomerase family protein n=1 Tax=unclassified Solwaraspora TaxID=2627926 RepID=UPI00259B645C|nr:enoyl-CoA hydratase/isomerase family protein [Solwaraspora sp. WMMA2056]WJK39587.1 enoyl-CoA hydratase/isomerase family protein [Solwaraspora sp. WMMA2056]
MTDVRYATDDQVMTIVLDGPETMNSLTPAAIAGLDAALAAAEVDHTLRAVVITGVGDRAFSVGMDIDFLESCFADPQRIFLPFLRSYHAVLRRIERLGVPVVARVNGLARAGGFELILACDFVIAADEAKVGDIHLEFGMPPGAGSSQRAPRKLGDQRAKALMLTPLWLRGPELVQWGVALASAPRAQLDDEVGKLLSSLRGRSRPAMAITKRLLNSVHTMTLEEGLRYEREMFSRLHEEVPEVAEGYRAFVDKREPVWGDVDVRDLG